MIVRQARRVVVDNKRLKVYEDEVEFANGYRGDYWVVKRGSFSVVVPVDGEEMVMVRQFRYVSSQWSLEFPMGKSSDKKASALEHAQIELREETGLVAKKWKKLGSLWPAQGYVDQRYSVFEAREFEVVERELEKTEEDMEVVRMQIAQVEKKIVEGEIVDAPTVSAYGLWKLLREKRR